MSRASHVNLAPAVETTVLDHGLRVTTVALPHLHTATVAAFIKVGSRFESPDANGLSHFTEHMLFRGTERYPTSLAVNTAIERLGSTLHAETGRDYTLFSMGFEPACIGAGLEVLGELLARPRFGDIELERALVLEEINEDYDEDDVEINADDIARGLMFGDHALGQRIIGPRGNVERFTEADVRGHFARFYGARNMILCVAGPVEHDAVVELARRHLADLPPGAAAEPAPAPPGPGGPRWKHVRDSGAQTTLAMLFRGVPELDPGYHAFVGLLRALDDGMSTRLHYQLADQKGLAYSIGAGIEPLADAALFEITSATANAKLPTLVAEILALVGGLRAQRIDDDELTKIRTRYRYETLASLDDPAAMAGWFGGTALYYPPPPLAERLAAMARVTADDIVESARRVLTPDGLVLAAVGALSKARIGELREVVATWR
ncbi:MAG: insulinase family protein [Kofleriaceae bacterium]|nr:insulinase family protein [Kofleriaceae bacterium]